MRLTGDLLAPALCLALCAAATATAAQEVTLSIESWRTDDLAGWEEQIIPAFEAANPGIKVKFAPTAPAQYDAELDARFADGAAGDLIGCRPFVALSLFEAGHLAPLDALPGMESFPPLARAAWATEDGSTVFCVPIAAVLHGFIFNAEALAELGLSEPTTVAEFHDLLQAIAADGRYLPLALGTGDASVAMAVGYQNIGPTYWGGEAGRQALLAGKQKLTDENWLAPYRELARWKPYMGDGFEARTYSDSQNLFTLGRAVIYPAGSWEIAGFNANAPFELGAFPPPALKAGDRCQVSEHAEIGLGLNARSPHAEAARKFLSFVASEAFGALEANALPGLYPLGDGPVTVDDPLAQEFAGWRDSCERTLRSTDGPIGLGTPDLAADTAKAVVQVIKGAESPETVAARLHAGLDSWYKPPN